MNTCTVLITGFEPFGGEPLNPSWEAVRCLPDSVGESRIIKMELPVIYGKAAELVLRKIEEVRPDIVICTGVAGGRASVTPELIGVNLMHARIPDAEGNSPQCVKAVPGAPDGLFSRLPVWKMTENMQAAGIPAEVSYSAGSYVCNDLMYRVLYAARDTGLACGFIHVPYMEKPIEEEHRGTEQSGEGEAGTERTKEIRAAGKQLALPLAVLTEALRICVETCVNEV